MGITPAARDETTTRTYEIPACGGFMLHERSPELQGLFEEDKEVACFASGRELAEKIEYYLAHPEERKAIAAAGHARCVPAYSYDHRVAQILRWHCRRAGISLPAFLQEDQMEMVSAAK
jgi:spore maturation protein CgeB